MKFLSDILAKAGLTVDGVVTLNNTATGQTPAANDNSTKLATTAWVRGFVTPYSLPIASSVTLGGVKIGSGLAIDGTGIVSVTTSGVGAIRALQQITATAGQTVFTVSGGYTPGLIDVFLNGVLLTPTAITSTNGTTFTLADAALVNDLLDIFVYNPIYNGFISTTDQVPEGATNLYYTNARARAAISLTTTGSSGAATYNSSTGVLNIPSYIGGVVSIFGRTGTVVAVSGDYTTTLVTEGTNLYYTDARARAAISVTGSGSYDSATGIITVTGGVTSVNTLTGAVVLTTTNIAEGTNLYYTDSRVLAYLTANSYATQTYVGTQIANLVASAPATLDTLNELAVALGNDPNFATTVATSIGTKVPQTRTITINGTAYDLSADRSWTIASGVTSFNTRTGAIVPVSGDYTTALVTESGNLYYTDARARLALSFVAGSGGYNSTTGVITIPTNNNQITNGANYITLVSLSSTATGLTYTNTTGVFSLTAGYSIPTDASQTTWDSAYTNRITSLTTTGTSGAATLSGNVLNIPQYQGGVTSFNTRTGAITLTSSDVTTALTYTPVTNARTLTINGDAYDLTADRTWTIGVSPSARTIQTYTATAAQTTFTVTGGYVVGLVDVFINGVRLTSADFTATNGTTVVLTTGTGVNNIVDVIKYTSAFTASSALRQVTYFTATAGQTSFTVSYTPGLVDVYYNGSKLAASEYTASNGTTVVISNAAVVNDALEVISYAYSVGAYSGIGGSGTINTIPKFTAASTIGDSNITDTGSLITLGSNTTISSGALGIAETTLTGYSLRISKNITGLTSAYGVRQSGTVQSDVTADAIGFRNDSNTQAAAFTLTNYWHFWVRQGSIGAGSAITNQYGYVVDSNMIGATNNYAFQGNIPSGTNRWNIYMAGTAANYLAGDTAIGTTTLGTATTFTVGGTQTASSAIARGQLLNTTLVASANNDVLVGLDINPTFTNGAFTGVRNLAARINGDVYLKAGSSVIATNFRNIAFEHTSNGNILGYIGLNQQSGEMRFIANSGGYFQTFYSNGSEAMRIHTSRNIAIGTTTDAGFKLDVNGTARVQGLLTVSTGGFSVTGNSTLNGDLSMLGYAINNLYGVNITNAPNGGGVTIRGSSSTNTLSLNYQESTISVAKVNWDSVQNYLHIQAIKANSTIFFQAGAATFSSSVTASSSIISTTIYGGTFRATDGTNEVRFGSYFNTIGSGNSYDGVIYTTHASSALYLMTAGNTTPKVTISSSGYLGIGSNNPARILYTVGVSGGAEWVLEDTGSSINQKKFNIIVAGNKTQFRVLNDANSGGTVWLTTDNSNGFVGIGSIAPARRLTVQNAADDGTLQIRMQGPADTTSYCEIGRESASTGDFRINVSRTGTVINALRISDTTGNATFSNSITAGGNLNIANTLAYGRAIISTSETKNNSTLTGNSAALFLSTNETSQPFGVKFFVLGNTVNASRYVTLQTGEHNYANDGNLILQPNGGNVGVGITIPSGKFGLQTTGADGLVMEPDLGSVNNSGRLFFKSSVQTYALFNNSADLRLTYDAVPGNTSGTSLARFTNTGKYFRMEAGTGGIQFNGNTGAANALNAYEEGTWTPVITCGSGGASYNNQLGWYTKIGRVVTITWFIAFTKGSLSGGTVGLTSLPFSLRSGTFYPQGTVLFDNLSTVINNITLQGDNNAASGTFIESNGGTTDHAGLATTRLGSGIMACRGTLTYFTA